VKTRASKKTAEDKKRDKTKTPITPAPDALIDPKLKYEIWKDENQYNDRNYGILWMQTKR